MAGVQVAPFEDYTRELHAMAEVLREVVAEQPDQKVSNVLEKAAKIYGTTASQMKYALSFAGVKNLVKVDYDSSTVAAAPAA
ncbi:MAG: hypothetical protein E2601_06290 [Microbacterium sp.]|nr:hypothetical protein [Microbacterium sp.]